MPALPSRPSTTTARRCVASCTDRTPQRFRQAFTPAASANRGQLPRTTTALQRTLFAVVTRRVSATGASTSLPHSSATVRSLSRLCEKLGVARVQPQPVCRAVSSPPSFMLNPPSPLLATTAQPEAERGTAIPPGKPYPVEANPWSGREVAVGLLGIVASSEVADASGASGNQ